MDLGYDVWQLWRDNRLRLPHWYGVAKGIALIQPSSAFMERVFSILRSCMDERKERSFSDRVAASALLKYMRTEDEANRSVLFLESVHRRDAVLSATVFPSWINVFKIQGFV